MKTRRHHNNKGEHQVRTGKTRDQVERIANRLARERTARELYEAAKEAIVEVEYWHADMLSPEERAHPRGSGWARVHDSLSAALAAAREAWGWEE